MNIDKMNAFYQLNIDEVELDRIIEIVKDAAYNIGCAFAELWEYLIIGFNQLSKTLYEIGLELLPEVADAIEIHQTKPGRYIPAKIPQRYIAYNVRPDKGRRGMR